AQDYKQRAVKANDYDGEKTKEVVSNYNLLLNDLTEIIYKWGNTTGSCDEKLVLEHKSIQYNSSLKFVVKENSTGNKLLDSLKDFEDYDLALKRVLSSAEQGLTPNIEDIELIHLYQQALYSKEKKINQKDISKLDQKLSSIIEALGEKVKKLSLPEFKLAYENIIEAQLNKTLKYNKAYFSVPSKVFKGKTQCSGGTKTDLLLNLKLRGADYYQKRPVVIITDGHILPGFLTGHENEWHLFGVETTTSGESLVYLGDIQEISRLMETTLVIDAFDYLYINAIQAYLEEPAAALNKVFYQFAAKYGVRHAEDLLNQAKQLPIEAKGKSKFKGDVLAIGKSSQKRGTSPREPLTYKAKDDLASLTPSDVLEQIKSKLTIDKLSSKIAELRKKIKEYEYLSLPEKKSQTGMVDPEKLLADALTFNNISRGEYSCEAYSEEGAFPLSVKSNKLVFIMPDKSVSTFHSKTERVFYLNAGKDEQFEIILLPQGAGRADGMHGEFEVAAYEESEGGAIIIEPMGICKQH
ncbi:MAG: hypothetical protein HON90_18120, partial [Halobacteriovoraceae bacterium]|nr:hypothetical protein [Halobacteriovoraceae bacterium]